MERCSHLYLCAQYASSPTPLPDKCINPKGILNKLSQNLLPRDLKLGHQEFKKKGMRGVLEQKAEEAGIRHLLFKL